MSKFFLLVPSGDLKKMLLLKKVLILNQLVPEVLSGSSRSIC